MKYCLVVALLLQICLNQTTGCAEGCTINNCFYEFVGDEGSGYYQYQCWICQANYFEQMGNRQCVACPLGTISNEGATESSQCIANYNQSCSTFNGSICSSCSQNYYFSANGQCISCQSGYYSPNANNLSSCYTCEDNGCQLCYSNTGYCQTCAANYFFSNMDCIFCGTDMWNYPNNTQTQCYSCTNNFCETCAYNAAYGQAACLTCQVNYYLDTFFCYPCNSAQYTPNSNNMTSCIQCPQNCANCNSSGCQQCLNGYYVDGTGCAICIFPCTSCSSATVCLGCISPINLNGTSCLICPVGYYAALEACQPCSVGCYSCQISGVSFCYMCAINYTLVEQPQGTYICIQEECTSSSPCPQICPIYCSSCSQNGTCTSCVGGYYIYSYLCIQCNQPCSTCSNYTNCTSCQAMNYLNNGSCFSCPNNQVSNANNTLSFCCQANCSTCLNNANCLTCQQNYYMIQGSMCNACPNALYTPVGNTYTFCSSSPVPLCSLFCQNCMGSTCLGCVEGYNLNDNNCVFNSDNNNNDSSSGISKSTVIVLATVIPICVLLIIGIIIYCVRKNSNGETKPKTLDFEISSRKYSKLTENNLV